ncbi:SDR family NAD(P)-dependent oxidoreductase [Pedobacter duraquae]|uniref:NAD(P)-dependent dehydrogenase (Short-subunit alcohol dehydrogenase family) n=1 Tax=Pedobacter duraquae TaxID=425511 RepID=A0A4R6IKJ9_9SPHI|nr:SDR family oxidoreductase [Pedobacter duraquae]TDO22614.1 NAD(P)-dependent dehydrogenase (short-subunit alcohol dehydrogenase family) [Pedobacter duraquae]
MINNQKDSSKVAIIIGGSTGIGKSTAIKIAERGVGVILTYNTNRDKAEQTVAEIENAGGHAVALLLDAGRSETFILFKEAILEQLKSKWNRETFHYLVNNAGFGEMASFEATTEELFDRNVSVMLKAPFFITQHLLPLLEDGASIVNTTSTAALVTGIADGASAYGAVKAGLVVLSKYMAKEFSKRKIRVNSVAPGPTKTNFADSGFERFPEFVDIIANQTALGRVGEAEDLSKVIISLLSDDFGWVTGQDIEVSGGFHL